MVDRVIASEDAQADQDAATPLALVAGETVTKLPRDLYIPPDALRVFLETFEGPLDLLLYLIRKQNLDILDIQVSVITEQYIRYIELMQTLHLDLVGEYLVMAALLTQIKSQKILPRSEAEDVEDEADPRLQLLRQLREYERFKEAANSMGMLPALGCDMFNLVLVPPTLEAPSLEKIEPGQLSCALQDALARAERDAQYKIRLASISTDTRMSEMLHVLATTDVEFVSFAELYRAEEGRLGIAVSFLALLELVRSVVVEVVQTQADGSIHVRML